MAEEYAQPDAASPDAAQTARKVFTIGHSTRPFEDVLGMLRENNVTTLVDVRSYPSSRRFPQWNQESIKAALPADIKYVWLKKLGGRRHTPAGVDSPNHGWRVKAFRDYADYMATDEFGKGLKDLLALAENETPAIMCSEAVPWRCHRRLITDALLNQGVEVADIMSKDSVRPATMTPFAEPKGALITYPAS